MWMIDTNLGIVNSNMLQTNGAYKLVNSNESFNGVQYQRINFATPLSNNGFSRVGIANYGLNCQLGMFFVAGKDYMDIFIYEIQPQILYR